MDRVDAEEYTQALAQAVGASWRQVRLAQKLGVPKALGLQVDEWVKNRLGGYIRLEISERREAAKELSAEGASTREIAAILGVSQKTADRDVAESNDSRTRGNSGKSESNDSLIYDGPDGKVYDFTETTGPKQKPNPEWEKFEKERNQREGLYGGLREIGRWAYLFTEGPQRDYMVRCFVEHRDEVDEQSIVMMLAKLSKNIIETLEGIRDEQIRRTGEAFTSRSERGH